MDENPIYLGTFADLVIRIEVIRQPTPQDRQRWKELWTWLLRRRLPPTSR
jgi:hypothetical protein